MTQELRKLFLDIHNRYRSQVAKGKAKDKAGGNAPKAASMRKMLYDCEVEESARRHAVGCRWGHSSQENRKGLGENLYYTSNTRMSKAEAAKDSCKVWFDELAKRGVGQEDNVLTQEVWNKPGQIGHYTQMVWQDTYRLGCYVHRCPSMTYVVCQYGPRGNWIGDPIYEMGNPCKTDDDCMCSNCKCSRKEALCIVH
ncbi:SCP-like protein [Ancylostoma ceylanicum]|uniref:SCP-like protein n=1 Tax=Ancylostoma ceylanicum TaxID=53326 RepID=A0A0D6LIS6_9BILA|nr:SCP-like protein [Ancylostoma ceylanicum]